MIDLLRRHHRLLTYQLLPVFLLAVAARLLPGERPIDDSYITFRYARNLVQGVGFVYNPGERVLGTTTPLYTLAMAGLSIVFQTKHYPSLAIGLNALADGVACALLVPLGVALSGRRRVGLAAGALYAVAPFSVTFAIGGMETSVVVLLLIATAVLYLHHQSTWGLTAALAILTRPDALIFLAPLGLDYLVRALLAFRQKTLQPTFGQFIKPILIALLVLAPWLVFATLYFGSPIPHSIAAKTAAYFLKPTEGFVRLLQHYTTPFFEQDTFSGAPALLTFLSLYLVLSLLGILSAFRHRTQSLAITTYPFLYFAVFAIANPLIFRWYLTPPLPFYFLIILIGLAQVFDGVTRRWSATRLPLVAFTLVGLFFFSLSLHEWKLTPDHGPSRPAPDMAWFKLEQLYTQIGQDLTTRVDSRTVIAAGDIGALGYFSDAKILDTLGLISPQATAYYPLRPDQLVITYAISADLIADQQPDYVVFLEVYGRKTLLVDERFLTAYTLQQKIDTDIYGSDGMLVYRRNTTSASAHRP
jgi:hypothetical protein